MWLYALCTAPRRVSAGTRRCPRVRCGPELHSRMVPSLPLPSVWTPMRGPRPEQEAPSRQRRYWTAMRPNAKPRIHGTTRTERLTLLSKAPDRFGWRGAPGRTKEPIVRGPSRRVPAPSWPSPAACPSFIPASAFLLSCVTIHVAAHQETTGSRALQQPVDSWIHVSLHRPKLRGVVRFRGVSIYAPGRSNGGYRGQSDLPRRYTAIDCLFPTSAPPTVARRISETCD